MDKHIIIAEHQADAQILNWDDLSGEGAKGALNAVESAVKAASSAATFVDFLSSLPAGLKPSSQAAPDIHLPTAVCRPVDSTGAPGDPGNGQFALPPAVCRPVDRAGITSAKPVNNEFVLPAAVCRPDGTSFIPGMPGGEFFLPPGLCKPVPGAVKPLGARGEASSPGARPTGSTNEEQLLPPVRGEGASPGGARPAQPSGEQSLPPARPAGEQALPSARPAGPTGDQPLPPARPAAGGGDQLLPPAKLGDGSDKLPPVGGPKKEVDSLLEKAMVNYIAKALEVGSFGDDARNGLEQVFRASPTAGRKLVQKINEQLAQTGDFRIELIESPTNATDKQKAPEWDVVLKSKSKTSDTFHLVGKCP